MKKIKKYFLLILTVSLIAVLTNVKAYSGVVDSNDDIQMPSKLVSGQGEVTISRNFHDYTMSYQLVEIDNNTYKEISKLKEELLVAEYYNIYEADQSDLNYDNYTSAYKYYQEKYGVTVDDYTEKHINEVLSQIIGLWPSYTDNWTVANGKNINIDLSTISGTHDYVIWTKVVTDTNTIYDADAYELVGTKIENNTSSDNNTNNNDTNNNNTSDNNNGNKTNNDNTNNGTDNSTDNNTNNNTSSDTDNDSSNNVDNNNTNNNDNSDSSNSNDTNSNNNTSSDNNTESSNNTNNLDNSSNISNDGDDKNTNNNSTKNETSSSSKKDTSGDTTLIPEESLPYTGILTNIALFAGIASAVVGAIVSFRKMKNIK